MALQKNVLNHRKGAKSAKKSGKGRFDSFFASLATLR